MTYLEHSIALADVAKATRSTVDRVEEEARALGLYVGANWAGMPAVEERDAAALVDGSRRRQHDADEAMRDHQRATAEWEAQRLAVTRAAELAAYQRAMAQPAATGGVYMTGGHGDEARARREATEAARGAAADFERTHPAPTIGGQATVRNWFSKVKEAVL